MNDDVFVNLAREGLWLILLVSLFPLLASLIVGLLVSLFQALTQIQEQTLTFVPKIVATILVIIIAAPFMLKWLTAFGEKAFKIMLDVSVIR